MSAAPWLTGGPARSVAVAPARRARGRRTGEPSLESLEGRTLLSGLIAAGAGPGGAPTVTVLDADTGAERFRFSAYDPGMTAGVRVAVGDVNGDGTLDIVTAPGPGEAPLVKVFRSTDGAPIGQFAVPQTWALGGVWVAAGDVNGDGRADIVVAPGRGTPDVRVYDGPGGHL